MSYGLRDVNGVRVELCDECGFDAREPRDLAPALAAAFATLQRLTGHRDAGRRPAEETWSGLEYAEHCVDVADQIVAVANRAVARPGTAHLASLSEATTTTVSLVDALTETEWDAVTDAWPFEVSVRGAMIHLLHDLEHHVLDVRRGYAKLALADGVVVVTSR